jgi:hypothetical protein
MRSAALEAFHALCLCHPPSVRTARLLAAQFPPLVHTTFGAVPEEMVYGASPHVVADGGMTLLEEFLSKGGGTLSVDASRESSEVSRVK